MENNYKSAMDKICLRKEFPEEMKKCLEQKAKVRGKKTQKITFVFAVTAILCCLTISIMQHIPAFPMEDRPLSETVHGMEENKTGKKIVISSDYSAAPPSYMFLVGKCFVAEEVKKAMENTEDALFFVQIFISSDKGPVAMEEQIEELKRMKDLGYDVFFYSIYEKDSSKDKEKMKEDVLAGLLTKEQIENFSVNPNFAYGIEWVRNTDGILEWSE